MTGLLSGEETMTNTLSHFHTNPERDGWTKLWYQYCASMCYKNWKKYDKLNSRKWEDCKGGKRQTNFLKFYVSMSCKVMLTTWACWAKVSAAFTVLGTVSQLRVSLCGTYVILDLSTQTQWEHITFPQHSRHVKHTTSNSWCGRLLKSTVACLTWRLASYTIAYLYVLVVLADVIKISCKVTAQGCHIMTKYSKNVKYTLKMAANEFVEQPSHPCSVPVQRLWL